jgi:hypothetical protein
MATYFHGSLLSDDSNQARRTVGISQPEHGNEHLLRHRRRSRDHSDRGLFRVARLTDSIANGDGIRVDHPFWQRGALNRQGGWGLLPGPPTFVSGNRL